MNTKSLLMSVLMIGVVAMAAGAGTLAYYTDTETSTGNTFTAGTLDLSAPAPQAQTEFTVVVPSGTKTIELDNEAPGDSGTGRVLISNLGSLSGELDVAVGAINNKACNPDGRHDGSEYCDVNGHLGGVAKMALWLDLNKDNVKDATDVGLKSDGTKYNPSAALVYATVDSYGSVSWDDGATMDEKDGVNDEAHFVIEWQIPGTAGNNIQGDGISFDVDFTLEQAALDA